MKSFLLLVGVAVVAGAMYVAAASGSQQSRGVTAKQFKALKRQVATLSKTVDKVKLEADVAVFLLAACDKHAVPIDEFGDGSATPTEGYEYSPTSSPNTSSSFLTTALDIAPSSDTSAAWFAYGDHTCNTALGGLRHVAAKAGIRLPRAASRLPSFTPHRP